MLIASPKHFLFGCVWGVAIASLPALAAQTDSTFVAGKLDAPVANESVMGLPYSTQWESEQIGSYFYVSYDSGVMASPEMQIGSFTSNFGDSSFGYPAVDYFTHFTSFAGPESSSSARYFSLWGRYSLGFADLGGHLSAADGSIDPSVETTSLIVFAARIGTLLSYDRISWVRPFVGVEVDPYYFRHTASISGAEEQGEAFCFGPGIGAHFPVLFGGKASILAEIHRDIAIQGLGQIMGSANTYDAGMGFAF